MLSKNHHRIYDSINFESFCSYYQRMCLQPIRGNKNVTKEYVLELLNYNNKPELMKELILCN